MSLSRWWMDYAYFPQQSRCASVAAAVLAALPFFGCLSCRDVGILNVAVVHSGTIAP
jgi:hypothetical protein